MQEDKVANDRRRREFREHVDSNQDGVADQVCIYKLSCATRTQLNINNYLNYVLLTMTV